MSESGDLLSSDQRAWLLKLARESAAAALGGPPVASTPPQDAELLTPRACFVTFKRRDAGPGMGLRGCLGTLQAREALWLAVKRLAADTVTEDPRFSDHPVTLSELPQLEIDISVLHPRRELDDPLTLELGQDGIVVEGQGRYGGCHGVYLPQVATEHGMGKEEFLSSCCSHKAGLPADAWRDANQCKVFAFRAEVFCES